ncbi:sensor with HAMP domain protein [Paenibacillus sp. MY03]|jgi:two-component system sensor histidine kinase YesM|uniref:sensor histidine kinase n=1 Tax=Paenibacillus sp. MY03 TaxID=302980 RepID=UPI000B3C2B40|nr:sensor histidine kinase [Paenibacillus sp. MY03]OUS78107.1 sensor with HAMP domain protein [Paenibacillus sp. MY03]
MRIFGWRTYIPFTYKMMIPYLLLVLIMNITIGYVSYFMLVKSRTEVVVTGIRAALEQTKNNVDYRMAEIQRMSDQLFGSVSFQRSLQKQGDRLSMYHNMLDEIMPQLAAPLKMSGSPVRLLLYAKNEDLGEIGGGSFSEPITDSKYFLLQFSALQNEEWFRSLEAANEDNLWLQVGSDRELNNISHFRKLVSYSDYKTVIGYIQFTVGINSLLGNVSAYSGDSGMQMYFFDRTSGQSLFGLDGNSLRPLSGDKTALLDLREDVGNTPYTIEIQVPYSYLNQDASRLQWIIGWICAACFVAMGAVGFAVAELSRSRMKRIVSQARAIQDGDLSRRIDVRGNDEFVIISLSFNVLASSIQTLIKDVYRQGMLKKQAELAALQAQINPHFLYNTLSTISSLSNLGKTNQVTEMVKRLSSFYRLTLNGGQVLIPLGKELEQVKAYLAIQKVKYDDAFQVYIEMEPTLKEMKVIKLIVQPFVENCFKHAWFGQTIAIRITAAAFEGKLEIKVIDTGIGMKKERLEQVRNSAAQSNAYGLKNVEERIKLKYGNEFGVTIHSIYGGGTTVRLLLPLRSENEEGGAEDRYEMSDAGGEKYGDYSAAR